MSSDTTNARRAFLESRSPDQLRAQFSTMGAKSGDVRRGGVFLTREEREALGEAYALLGKIAARIKLEAPSDDEIGAAA